MRTITSRLAGFIGASALLLTLLPGEASAVAGFARQTGMSCNQCHTSHGGATPNFTFTGKKFNAMGYRLPGSPHTAQTRQESGEPDDLGEYLSLLPAMWSGRVQSTFVARSKGPGAADWGETTSNPTSRFSIFPFIGPVGEHWGMWTEAYIATLVGSEWGIATPSFEEMDFRYIINPKSRGNVYGLAMTNQGIGDLFGFGPWPTDLDSDTNRGVLQGWTHPNKATVAAYGWMSDRWIWALGANTGDTNYGWDKANGIGILGYAIKNRNDNELWVNFEARYGSDALPIITSPSIGWVGTRNRNEFVYGEDVRGVGATRASCPTPDTENRAAAGCAYLAEEMDNHLVTQFEVRWSGQNVGRMFSSGTTGSLSYEMVARVDYLTEEYNDGAETEALRWGFQPMFAWNHTYYVRPYVRGYFNYEFTAFDGTGYDIDTKPTYGAVLSYKPVENFLINFNYSRPQRVSLTGEAQTGQAYSISTDISW